MLYHKLEFQRLLYYYLLFCIIIIMMDTLSASMKVDDVVLKEVQMEVDGSVKERARAGLSL